MMSTDRTQLAVVSIAGGLAEGEAKDGCDQVRRQRLVDDERIPVEPHPKGCQAHKELDGQYDEGLRYGHARAHLRIETAGLCGCHVQVAPDLVLLERREPVAAEHQQCRAVERRAKNARLAEHGLLELLQLVSVCWLDQNLLR